MPETEREKALKSALERSLVFSAKAVLQLALANIEIDMDEFDDLRRIYKDLNK